MSRIVSLQLLDGAFYEALNNLLKNATPTGAYAMGVVTVLAAGKGVAPDDKLLEAASMASSIPASQIIFLAWWRERKIRLGLIE